MVSAKIVLKVTHCHEAALDCETKKGRQKKKLLRGGELLDMIRAS
jgi:hypothetical protein